MALNKAMNNKICMKNILNNMIQIYVLINNNIK